MPPTDTDPRPDLVAAYVEHAPFVERVLRRAGVAERDVPDARQDVFVVAHRRIASFEGRGRLTTWLYRIAWNVASEYRRRACHRREQLGAAGGELDALPRPGDALDGSHALALEHRELLGHALHALDALDDDKREAFVLAEVVGLSMREVAARAGVPLKTAFSRAYAARRRVLAALRARGVTLALWPAWLPLRLIELRELRAAEASRSASSGSPWLAAQAQLALVALACAPLPGLMSATESPSTAPASALVALAPPTAQANVSSAPSIISAAPATASPQTAPRRRAASRAETREPAARAARAADPAPPVPELIVVHDGHAWLVPAVDHPLDRAPSLRPALPPILHLRGPRAALGHMPDVLPERAD